MKRKSNNCKGEIITLIVAIIGIVGAVMSAGGPVVKAFSQSKADDYTQKHTHSDVWGTNKTEGTILLNVNGQDMTLPPQSSLSYPDSVEDGWRKHQKSVHGTVLKADQLGSFNRHSKLDCGTIAFRGASSVEYIIYPDSRSAVGLRCEVAGKK